MALTEDEQRRLDQLAADLFAEDPHLVNTLRGATARKLHKRRAAAAGAGFVVGVVLLLAGMSTHWAVSVGGFIIMLVSTVLALGAWERVEVDVQAEAPAAASQPPFMSRMEERWRQRNEGNPFGKE